VDDAAALATLSAQLGYSASADALADRLGRVLPRADQVVLVGCGHANAILGWIHGAEQDLLEAERRCEILGLVVDQTQRRRGIGRRLVSALEQWASSRGLLEISVRSNVVRPESHQFYDDLGYQRVKTQHVYRKRLPHVVLTALACWALALGAAPSAIAQTGGGCEPVSQHARRELGCFITAREDLGIIPRDSSLYWHIDAYSTVGRILAPAYQYFTSTGRVELRGEALAVLNSPEYVLNRAARSELGN
jgi:GNAT superfamily N-acetyltransferase